MLQAEFNAVKNHCFKLIPIIYTSVKIVVLPQTWLSSDAAASSAVTTHVIVLRKMFLDHD